MEKPKLTPLEWLGVLIGLALIWPLVLWRASPAEESIAWVRTTIAVLFLAGLLLAWLFLLETASAREEGRPVSTKEKLKEAAKGWIIVATLTTVAVFPVALIFFAARG
jgi:hypothetical protein